MGNWRANRAGWYALLLVRLAKVAKIDGLPPRELVNMHVVRREPIAEGAVLGGNFSWRFEQHVAIAGVGRQPGELYLRRLLRIATTGEDEYIAAHLAHAKLNRIRVRFDRQLRVCCTER